MSNYIKPTVKLAAIAGNASLSSGCNTSKSDLAEIEEFLNEFGVDFGNAFANTEACVEPVPGTVYCKFTSMDTPGNVKILGS